MESPPSIGVGGGLVPRTVEGRRHGPVRGVVGRAVFEGVGESMAAVRGRGTVEASLVRICAPDGDSGGTPGAGTGAGADGEPGGQVVGAGFLVAPDVVCTCAHVVERAGCRPGGGGRLELEFPLVPGRPRATAAVVSWRPGGADTALLRLDAPVAGTRPVSLVDGNDVWGHTFRVLGYHVGADQGVWASGRLRAGQGSGWVQMEAHGPGPRIAAGFSGSPVWDDVQNGVVGMTVAAHRGERTAYLLPSAELVDERVLEPRCPFQGLAPFTAETARYFHGRDADTARVLRAVRGRPVTLVAGPSGCGKSSLVRAGVLPRLREDGTGVSELRPVPGVRASSALAGALIGALEPTPGPGGEVERLLRTRELAVLLDEPGDTAVELRSRVLARGRARGTSSSSTSWRSTRAPTPTPPGNSSACSCCWPERTTEPFCGWWPPPGPTPSTR